MEITGTLKNARFIHDGPDRKTLNGDLYGDKRGRFQDGERVITSRIMKEHGDGVYSTLNSTYKVEFAEVQ